MGGERVRRFLDEVSLSCALPETISVDNGPELLSNALDRWAYERGVKLHFIEPGKPTQNAIVESISSGLREERLNAHWFDSLDLAASSSLPGGWNTTPSDGAQGTARRMSSKVVGAMPLNLFRTW